MLNFFPPNMWQMMNLLSPVGARISQKYHFHFLLDFGSWPPVFGILLHYIPLSCTSSPCNLLFLDLGVYGFVQAAVGVGTVLIWDFCVAFTGGGVHVLLLVLGL
jgi:hypothetical protein